MPPLPESDIKSRRKIKIAVVIPKYGLIGGAETYAAQLTEKFALDPRFDVHVFANRWNSGSGLVTFHKVPIIRFPKFLTPISFAAFTENRVGKSYDIIHSHERIYDADIFTMHGIPHRIWIEEVRRKTRLSLFDRSTAWVENRLIRRSRCQRFVAVSELSRSAFLRVYREIAPERAEIVHPGVEPEEFRIRNGSKGRAEIRRELGVKMDEKMILFVSMNFDIKGLDLLFSILARLRQKYPGERWKLLVIGRDNIRKYALSAEKAGIGDCVLFPGVVPKNKLPEIYRAGDIYAMPSKYDTFGITVLEAMASSLPVLISENVGARDLIRDGGNGFVVGGSTDLDKSVDRIRTLMDEEVRGKMRVEALATANEHTWDVAFQKMKKIYRDVLSQKFPKENLFA